MSDLYGVQPDDIAAELRGLFPTGFDIDTTPTEAQVIDFISTADDIVRLRLVDITGGIPAVSDAAVRLAKTFIKNWVKSEVVKVVYAGQDPLAVQAAAKTYADNADTVITALTEMGSQAIGTGEASPQVSVAFTVPPRDLLVEDSELGDNDFGRERKY